VAKVLQDIWEDVLDVVRESVPAERFTLWFRSTELLKHDAEACDVGVPNAFVGEWLQEHFGDVVRGAVGKVTGEEIRVRFVVSPRLYQQSHERELRTKQELVEEIDSGLTGKPSSDEGRGLTYSLDDFVVGSCNRLAFAAAHHVASGCDRSLNPLVVHGAVGLGKTHLVRGICHEWNRRDPGGALYLSGESFTNQFLASLQHHSLDGFRKKFEDIGLLALDDLQFLASKPATQDEFLQVYNFLTNLNKQVVLASDSHPMEIERLRDTLRTRLVSGMMVRLDPPEYETRLAILRRKLDAKCDLVPEEVLAFIAESIRASVRELEGAATTLMATARLAGEKVDLTTARRAVASLMPGGGAHVGVDAIQDTVARAFHVTVEDIQSTRRHKSIALPRHVAMYLTRELTTMSWKEIGRQFGRRNHTGALFACKKIRAALETDPLLADRVGRLRVELGG